MDELMKEGMTDMRSQDDQMRMMSKMMIKQAKANDQYFFEVGEEEETLGLDVNNLGLQNDPEFQHVLRECY